MPVSRQDIAMNCRVCSFSPDWFLPESPRNHNATPAAQTVAGQDCAVPPLTDQSGSHVSGGSDVQSSKVS